MTVIIVIALIVVVLTLLTMMWLALPQIPPLTKKERVIRSVGVGALFLFLIGCPVLLFGLLNIEKLIVVKNNSIDLTLMMSLCSCISFIVICGIVAGWSTFIQTKHAEENLNENLGKIKNN